MGEVMMTPKAVLVRKALEDYDYREALRIIDAAVSLCVLADTAPDNAIKAAEDYVSGMSHTTPEERKFLDAVIALLRVGR